MLRFLKLEIKVVRPSIINIVNIHSKSKKAVSKISDFLFVVTEVTILVNIDVTNANSYQAIVSNNWLNKLLEKSCLSKVLELNENEIKDNNFKESIIEEEFEDKEIKNRVFNFFEIDKVKTKKPLYCLAYWILVLQEFDYTIQYCFEKSYTHIDTLSRI
ncbi:3728_t:CDS:2 [Dentiscutata heterogama]|uniref:3728_t:CDS:1 n=1 Tax=Dentiscutata heterogama TaxID=1316150 RepID=A0ACA9K433_9GLOM|nr:3728_t:CDS:2 [Dentiscutata heterogama]